MTESTGIAEEGVAGGLEQRSNRWGKVELWRSGMKSGAGPREVEQSRMGQSGVGLGLRVVAVGVRA